MARLSQFVGKRDGYLAVSAACLSSSLPFRGDGPKGRGGFSNLSQAAAAGPLPDADDHKLRRLHRVHPDLHIQAAKVDHLLRVGLSVALHIERLLRHHAKELALLPLGEEERGNIAPDTAPEVLVVRLEDHPLQAPLHRLFEIVEETPDVDILPGGIAPSRQSPSAPNTNASARERTDAVDPVRVQ